MTMTREENDEDERQRFDYRRARVTHASVSTSARTACVADGAYIITAYLPHVVCAYACERRTGACAPHAPALSRVWALDHAARVSSLAFDASSCVLASGDDAGVIVIRNVRDDDDDDAPQERIAHGVAIVALARERSGTKRRSSGLAWSDVHGTLTLRVNGILGHKHVVIDTNSGVIDTIAFGSRNVLAWSCDVGVKLYDVGREAKIALVERPRGSPLGIGARSAHVVWNERGDGGKTLVIAWADCVKVVKIERVDAKPKALKHDLSRSASFASGDVSDGAGSQSGDYLSKSHAVHFNTTCTHAAKVVSMFQTEYYIAGVQPFGDALALLAWTRGAAPELHVVSKSNTTLYVDVLAMKDDVENLSCSDYTLACAQPLTAKGEYDRCRRAGGETWWTPGLEPRLIVASPRDLILARPHGAKETIDWLSKREDYVRLIDACELATQYGHVDGSVHDVGHRVLMKIFNDGEYAQTAALCAKLLRRDAAAWEFWIEKFMHARALAEIQPYIPTENPTLSANAYETTLHAFLADAEHHPRFLAAVKVWPARVYSPRFLIPLVKAKLAALHDGADTSSVVLKEALAELYLNDGQRERALNLYLDIGRPSVLNFIARHDLVTFVSRKKLSLLAQLDTSAAMTLYVTSRDVLPPSVVVPELFAQGGFGARELTHTYLSALFDDDPSGFDEYHDMLFDLHLEFSPSSLMGFLKKSASYDVGRCAGVLAGVESLVFERVFLLSKLGSYEDAVRVLLIDAKDLEGAIKLASELENPRELWDVIIKVSTDSPEFMSTLLAHAKNLAGDANAIALVDALACGVPIENLKSTLVDLMNTNAALTRRLRASYASTQAAAAARSSTRAKIGARALRRHQIHISRKKPTAPRREYV